MREPESATSTLACILFRVANWHWAVDVSSIHRVHKQVPVHPVPGTQPWFLGVSQIDGQLLPVTDLSHWLGQGSATGAVLHLHPSLGPCGLRVDELFGTQNLPVRASALSASNTLMPGAVSQVVQCKDIDFRVIDMSVLVQSPAFIAIREARTA